MINNWSGVVNAYAFGFVVLFSALIAISILNFKWIADRQADESRKIISLGNMITSVGDVFSKTTG